MNYVFAVLASAGFDFIWCDRTERLPKSQQGLRLGLVDVKRFDRQAAGQLFDLAVPQSGGVRAAVKDADGFDFGFVVFDELTKTGDQCFGSLFGFGIETGGFDDASDFAVNVEAVVGFACCELEFAHRDSKPGHDVHVGHVLYFPPTLSQLAVNVLAGYGYGGSQS